MSMSQGMKTTVTVAFPDGKFFINVGPFDKARDAFDAARLFHAKGFKTDIVSLYSNNDYKDLIKGWIHPLNVYYNDPADVAMINSILT